MITSINLYDYSFKNNIEFGVYSEFNILGNFTTTPDQEAWNTSRQIADKNEVVFVKRPVYEKKRLSAILGKSYVKSDVLHDSTDKFYSAFFPRKQGAVIRKLAEFPSELELGSQPAIRPSREMVESSKTEILHSHLRKNRP